MVNVLLRSYSCKDEELPVICNFLHFSLQRDLADFTAYSPKFTQDYADTFKTKINTLSELVEPKSETVELKTITERLYATMDNLLSPINYLTGYIDLGRSLIPISQADFGLPALRKTIKSRDVEAVLKHLHTVNANIVKFNEALTTQGLSAELTATFSDAVELVANDKQKQYEIVSNRKTVVQNNIGLFNALFEQAGEIMAIGKILYKLTDKIRLQEYTFSKLKKRVRHTGTTSTDETPDDQ